jgi:carbonic anhydrase
MLSADLIRSANALMSASQNVGAVEVDATPQGQIMCPFPADLIDGYRAFRRTDYATDAERYRNLAERGQKPSTLVIACSDSRVDPSRIFNAGPGELFVVRNVANLVPPYEDGGGYHGTSAAIEFAVESLGVTRILVMGHGRCGGVRAFLAGTRRERCAQTFVEKWISLLEPAFETVQANGIPTDPEALQNKLEQVAVAHSIANLMTFPFIAKAVADDNLALLGGFFDIYSGRLQLLDRTSGRFEAVAA